MKTEGNGIPIERKLQLLEALVVLLIENQLPEEIIDQKFSSLTLEELLYVYDVVGGEKSFLQNGSLVSKVQDKQEGKTDPKVT